MTFHGNGPDKNLNLNIRGLKKSATIAINERAAQLKKKGQKIYKLGLGQSPFPVPEDVVNELKANAFRKDYLQTQGLLELRKSISNHFNELHEIESTAADVLVGPGSKELMFMLQLSYYGDLVVPTPAWVSYRPQAIIIGRHVQFMPTTFEDGWRIRPHHISEICKGDKSRPRIIVLNYPGNPSGTTYSKQDLKEIASEARKYKVIILSDEIYSRLKFNGEHVSIAKYYPEGTIISSGLSKWCGAGGWRLGCFVIPKSLSWLLEAMTAVASETYTATSAPIQYAAITAFNGNAAIEKYLLRCRRILEALGKECSGMLRRAGARVTEPEGAFYLFPDFTPIADKLEAAGINSSAEFCERCLNDTGVAFLPGTDFGRPSYEFTARLAYVDFDGEKALNALAEKPDDYVPDINFLRNYAGATVAGVEKLCDWVSSFS